MAPGKHVKVEFDAVYSTRPFSNHFKWDPRHPQRDRLRVGRRAKEVHSTWTAANLRRSRIAHCPLRRLPHLLKRLHVSAAADATGGYRAESIVESAARRAAELCH